MLMSQRMVTHDVLNPEKYVHAMSPNIPASSEYNYDASPLTLLAATCDKIGQKATSNQSIANLFASSLILPPTAGKKGYREPQSASITSDKEPSLSDEPNAAPDDERPKSRTPDHLTTKFDNIFPKSLRFHEGIGTVPTHNTPSGRTVSKASSKCKAKAYKWFMSSPDFVSGTNQITDKRGSTSGGGRKGTFGSKRRRQEASASKTSSEFPESPRNSGSHKILKDTAVAYEESTSPTRPPCSPLSGMLRLQAQFYSPTNFRSPNSDHDATASVKMSLLQKSECGVKGTDNYRDINFLPLSTGRCSSKDTFPKLNSKAAADAASLPRNDHFLPKVLEKTFFRDSNSNEIRTMTSDTIPKQLLAPNPIPTEASYDSGPINQRFYGLDAATDPHQSLQQKMMAEYYFYYLYCCSTLAATGTTGYCLPPFQPSNGVNFVPQILTHPTTDGRRVGLNRTSQPPAPSSEGKLGIPRLNPDSRFGGKFESSVNHQRSGGAANQHHPKYNKSLDERFTSLMGPFHTDQHRYMGGQPQQPYVPGQVPPYMYIPPVLGKEELYRYPNPHEPTYNNCPCCCYTPQGYPTPIKNKFHGVGTDKMSSTSHRITNLNTKESKMFKIKGARANILSPAAPIMNLSPISIASNERNSPASGSEQHPPSPNSGTSPRRSHDIGETTSTVPYISAAPVPKFGGASPSAARRPKKRSRSCENIRLLSHDTAPSNAGRKTKAQKLDRDREAGEISRPNPGSGRGRARPSLTSTEIKTVTIPSTSMCSPPSYPTTGATPNNRPIPPESLKYIEEYGTMRIPFHPYFYPYGRTTANPSPSSLLYGYDASQPTLPLFNLNNPSSIPSVPTSHKVLDPKILAQHRALLPPPFPYGPSPVLPYVSTGPSGLLPPPKQYYYPSGKHSKGTMIPPTTTSPSSSTSP